MKNGVSSEPEQRAFDEALASGDAAAAEAALDRLEQSEPNEMFTKTARARLTAALGDVDGAVKALKSLVDQHPKDGLPRAYYGSLLVALGDTMQGMTQLKTALGSEGGDVPAAHHALGVALLKAGRADEAASHLEQATERMTESPATFFYLGQAREVLGDGARAERAYERCVEIEPGFVEAWTSLVRARALGGRLDDAQRAVDEGLEANPSDPQLTRFAVQVAFDRGDTRAARQALEAIPEGERTVEDLTNLALLALGDKRFDDALAFADAAAARDGKHWRPAYLKGLALEGKGAPLREVVACHERALDAGDPAGEAATRLGYLLITGEAPDVDRAIDVLAAAAQRNGRAPGTVLNLALAYAKLGEDENARTLAAEVAESPRAGEHDKAEAHRLLSTLAS